jgi:hypothetical protein
MDNKEDAEDIKNKIKFLEIQKEAIESKNWDDKTHLEKAYKTHETTFYNVVSYLCHSVGTSIRKEINDDGFFSIADQKREERNFDIHKDYRNHKGENKLVCYVTFNELTRAHSLLHYSPTKGIAFEYAANLLPKNVQLGKGDFFGKTIENMIENIASATEGIKFSTNVERFKGEPNGLKYFYVITEDFVPKEKQGDILSIISTLDGLVRGLHKNIHWVSGPNFIHGKEDSEMNFG